MYVVDASVWVSWFVDAEAHHAPNRHWLGNVVEQGDRLVALPLVVAGFAAPLARGALILPG